MIVDRFVRKAVCFKPNTIVHVGANVAEEFNRYQALRPRRIVWVEADAEKLEVVRQKARASGRSCTEHICVEALVTDEDGQEMTFNVFSNAGESSSVFKPTQAFRDVWPDVCETGETRRLTSSRLDTVLQKSSIDARDVDILVIDTQGAELLCLKGAGAYLAHTRFVEVEVSQETIYEGGVLFPELDRFLSDAGFARVTRVPWHGDVVYVRKSELDRAGFVRLRRRAR
jgi:FkbM family methyltransferase